MMTRTELAGRLGGELVGVDGRVGTLSDPGRASADDVTVVLREKFLGAALESPAGTLVVSRGIEVQTSKALIRVTDVEIAWVELLRLFAPKLEVAGIDPTARVHPTALLEAGVQLGAFVVIGPNSKVGRGTVIGAHSVIGERVQIGPNGLIHERATIRHDCQLGARVLVQSGSVIGADGFGFHRIADEFVRQEQIGAVIIEDDVEIGANTVVDRGTLEPTRIGRGSKIGPSCVIAHNDQLGRNVILIGAVGLTGSVVIEDDAVLWGQTGTVGHVRIGKGAVLTAQSGLSKDLPAGETWRGSPAQPIKQQLRLEARIRQLEEFEKRLAQLESKHELSPAHEDR
jgi:UDP-3-O-[3-hydroxymyristoyl] glucosamine N-acyltransferase